ncbi:hypothetical protein PHYBOEH_003428 [Phytophthora boehmeriae]|uniref:RxLR effector protein n=1 Tax=Phytophthora boehmeriae TaxID=109152 RepID=A0A8T1WTK9_9STRA|nr:hypothetical protein PHYBOEH_003428 [Phytophthora boehmeriae]
MAFPDVVQSINAVQVGKRFLRTTKTQKYDDDDLNDIDDDDDDDDDDEEDNDTKEERMQRLPSFNGKWDKQLLKDIGDVPGAAKKIRGWNEQELTPHQVKGLLGITTLDKTDPDVRTYLLFLASYMRTHNIVH